MTVDPHTLKVIMTKIVESLFKEDTRNTVIILITIIVSTSTLFIILPIYILSNPIEAIKTYLSNDEEVMIYSLKQEYKEDFGMGNITINSKLGFPLENVSKVVITAEYGEYDPFGTGTVTKHTGIDLSGVHRDNVLAVESGIVTFAGIQQGYGNCVEIKHIIDGQELYSFYAHLSAIGVNIGQEVQQGYIIAKEGGDPYTDLNAGNSTGHHLHFEIRTKSGYGNDVNPKFYIFNKNYVDNWH